MQYYHKQNVLDKMLDKQKNKRAELMKNGSIPWQGQKDLNPRHAVLETAALPTELYPYMSVRNGGPSGTRTPDPPVMSRLL